MKSIRSIYIYVYNRTFSISLFFHIFSRSEVLDEMFGLDKCVEKRRHTHLLHTQSGNLSRSRYACAFILLNWIFQLDESNIATPRPKLETGSRAETGRFEFDSCRVRVPREKFEWNKRNEGEKKGQVLALSGYREKVYIWSKEPGSLSSNTVAASLWSFLKFLFQNSSYLSREKYSPAFRLKSTLNVERYLSEIVREGGLMKVSIWKKFACFIASNSSGKISHSSKSSSFQNFFAENGKIDNDEWGRWW